MTTFASSEIDTMPDMPQWVTEMREQAQARFDRIGFPSLRDEAWRFTNTELITSIDWQDACDSDLAPDQLAACQIPELDAALVVFVDGLYRADLSDLSGLGEAVTCLPLDQAFDRPGVAGQLGSLSASHDDGFTALNDAKVGSGLYIEVPADVEAERPIHVLSIATSVEVPVAAHPRVLIVAGVRARVQVIEHYNATSDEIVNLTNAVTEIIAAKHAFVEHYLLERESERGFNVSTLFIRQDAHSRVHSHTVLLGGSIVRNNVVPTLAGERAHCLINGLYVAHDEQHLDNQMRVRHGAPNCESRQYYKGIMMDRSRGVFTGRIVVDKAGQGTDAIQTNRNMLLSDDARVNARPQLEIFADDVRCTHGATTGRVDDEAVFYFRSRGLSEEVARAMLIYAFAAEGFDRMDLAPVRRLLAGEMIAKLPRAEGLSIEV
jgi:Fe-S cluster assembly protein SufD